jgi:hypothetical protein
MTAAEVREVLAFVPSRPAYEQWIGVISAVASVLDPNDAAAVLAEWSPEEQPGEYARKLRSPCKKVGVGTLIDLAKQNGFDASAFARRRAEGCRPAPRIAAAPTPPRAKPLPRYTLRPGTAADLETLARLRGLRSTAGLDAMQTAGCLAFADDLNDLDAAGTWRPVPAWIVLDPTRRNVSGRRLDGQGWTCCHSAKSRCLSGEGSKGWPVGITLAAPGQRLDVAEGEGDFLALWHLHALAGTPDAAPVGLLGSCASLDTFGPQIGPQVAGRTVQIFAHLDANGAGQTAATKWGATFYRLGAVSVRARNLAPWLPDGRGDLNDALRAALAPAPVGPPAGLCPACWARNIVAPAGGPTCTCAPYVWPDFTAPQISHDTLAHE